MTDITGLLLDAALSILESEGVHGIRIIQYTAPRDTNARGTLRAVRLSADKSELLVCRFPDTVKLPGDESEA